MEGEGSKCKVFHKQVREMLYSVPLFLHESQQAEAAMHNTGDSSTAAAQLVVNCCRRPEQTATTCAGCSFMRNIAHVLPLSAAVCKTLIINNSLICKTAVNYM
jgi:hypothetical protein